MIEKCAGCGVTLQTTNKDELGYITQSSLDNNKFLCKRCFDIVNYSKLNEANYTDEQFLEILKSIDDTSLFVMIVDVFDLASTLHQDVVDIISDKDVLLFVNKADVLMESINIEKLLSNIVEMYQDIGLNIIDGTLISAKYDFNMDFAKDLIDTYKNGRDIYVVGVSNVGKSQFISRLISQLDIHKVTVSHFPATTLNTLEFDYEDVKIIDTPGIINRKQLIHYIDKNDIKMIFPKKLKSNIYQFSEICSIFIGGFVYFEMYPSDKTAVTIFLADNLNIHRRKGNENEEFIQKHSSTILQPTYLEPKWVKKEIFVEKDHEIVINGLLVAKFNQPCSVIVHLHESVGINVRRKIF